MLHFSLSVPLLLHLLIYVLEENRVKCGFNGPRNRTEENHKNLVVQTALTTRSLLPFIFMDFPSLQTSLWQGRAGKALGRVKCLKSERVWAILHLLDLSGVAAAAHAETSQIEQLPAQNSDPKIFLQHHLPAQVAASHPCTLKVPGTVKTQIPKLSIPAQPLSPSLHPGLVV